MSGMGSIPSQPLKMDGRQMVPGALVITIVERTREEKLGFGIMLIKVENHWIGREQEDTSPEYAISVTRRDMGG